MLRNSLKSAVFAAGLLAIAVAAHAASPADTIKARQDNFKQMGKGMKAISDQLKSPAPSLDVIKPAAASIDEAAVKVYGYFPKGTGPEAGVKTGALPAIWEKPDEFKADAGKLVKAAAAMKAAAESGNLDAVKASFMPLGGACKECHENFRAREH